MISSPFDHSTEAITKVSDSPVQGGHPTSCRSVDLQGYFAICGSDRNVLTKLQIIIYSWTGTLNYETTTALRLIVEDTGSSMEILPRVRHKESLRLFGLGAWDLWSVGCLSEEISGQDKILLVQGRANAHAIIVAGSFMLYGIEVYCTSTFNK